MIRRCALTGLGMVLLGGCATQGTAPVATAAALPVAASTVGPEFQFLYGSAEAAALSRQAFRMLATKAISRTGAQGFDSVVLTPDATLDAPKWVNCGTRPHAAVFDADETVILNYGAEERAARHPGPFDEAEWSLWEQSGMQSVAPVPGAVEAFAAMRKAGITMIINTNRSAANAAGTIAALKFAGLGDFVLGDTLFLKDGASGKDGRRATISAKYCVVAMAGDQLGDFSDLFAKIASPAVRRAAADSGRIGALWGDGWFVLPNPVYGSALKGGFDDVFPLDKRWAPPAAAEAK